MKSGVRIQGHDKVKAVGRAGGWRRCWPQRTWTVPWRSSSPSSRSVSTPSQRRWKRRA